ncbi:hypothetical protein EYF80_015588 [Liparis tanakae]|uniref:Uncharacterized protein n=1 Tax=Liparis tanakae TaxID=230148 RepID=A0A4Z2IAH8_9TELE|nr:hypothetical protein EYF80_015588 [Liparis tanakae]
MAGLGAPPKILSEVRGASLCNTTVQHHWTTPLDNTTGQHHWTTPLDNTTGQHHCATPLDNTTGQHCFHRLNLGLGATMGGAHFLGACCWETEMLALPKVVSILAATCPVWSLLFTGFHMVLRRKDESY